MDLREKGVDRAGVRLKFSHVRESKVARSIDEETGGTRYVPVIDCEAPVNAVSPGHATILINQDGQWKLATYSLTLLIPNDIAHGVGKQSREADEATDH